MTRRKAFVVGSAALGGLAGAAVVLPVVGFAVAPVLTRGEERWEAVGTTGDFDRENYRTVVFTETPGYRAPSVSLTLFCHARRSASYAYRTLDVRLQIHGNAHPKLNVTAAKPHKKLAQHPSGKCFAPTASSVVTNASSYSFHVIPISSSARGTDRLSPTLANRPAGPASPGEPTNARFTRCTLPSWATTSTGGAAEQHPPCSKHPGFWFRRLVARASSRWMRTGVGTGATTGGTGGASTVVIFSSYTAAGVGASLATSRPYSPPPYSPPPYVAIRAR